MNELNRRSLVIIMFTVFIGFSFLCLNVYGSPDVFNDGFEGEDFITGPWDSNATVGTGTIDANYTVVVYEGSESLRIVMVAQNDGGYIRNNTLASANEYWAGFMFRLNETSTQNQDPWMSFDPLLAVTWVGGSGPVIKKNETGYFWGIRTWNQSGVVTKWGPEFNLLVDTWYWVEIHYYIDDADGFSALLIDDVLQANYTGLDTNVSGDIDILSVYVSQRYTSPATEVYIDRVIVDTSQIGMPPPSDTPMLISPWNGTREELNTNVVFKWNFTDLDTPQYAYEIEIDNNTDFSSPEVDTGKIVSTNNFTVQIIPSIIDTFYWRVRTWDNGNSISSWSSVREFVSDRVNLTLSVSDNRVNVNSTLPLVTTGVYESDGTDFVEYQTPTPNSWDIYLELDVDIFEASGAAEAIEAAVNQVDAKGNGTVYLPAGTFNFIIPPANRSANFQPAGVLIPGGVSIIGAGKDLTVLKVYSDPPPIGASMFYIDGRNDLFTRISGIGFEGFVNTTEDFSPSGISILGAKDFRIDHCDFNNFSGTGIFVSNHWASYGINRGVIDHCDFDNPYKGEDGSPEGGASSDTTLWGYGISPVGTYYNWEPDINALLGRYDDTENILYIEDSTFNRCREGVASNGGAFFTIRASNLTYGVPRNFHSIDVHGGGVEPAVGGRGAESYDNIIIGGLYPGGGDFWSNIGLKYRGGGGVIYNITLIDLGSGIEIDSDGDQLMTDVNDLWIWNGSSSSMTNISAPDPGTWFTNLDPGKYTENSTYYLYKKGDYVAYPYPHPYSQGYVKLNDTRIQTVAGLYGYKTSSIIDWNYNLTVFDSPNDVFCIFDQQNITDSSANNTTPVENEWVLLSVRFFSAYDNHELNGTDGDILTLGDDQEPMNYYDFTYNGTDWNCETSWSSNGTYEIDKVVFLEEQTYGITLGSMDGGKITIAVGETSGNEPPYAPTLNSPANDTRYDLGESVTFTWTFGDPNESDTQSAYQIQLDNNADFSSPEVDSNKVVSATEQTNQNIPSLTDEYYWRVRTWDSYDLNGSWSLIRTVIGTQHIVTILGTNNSEPYVGNASLIYALVEDEYDGHSLAGGDTLILEFSNGTAIPLTHNGTYWEAILISWTATTAFVDNYDTLDEQTYGISLLKTDFSLEIEWMEAQGNPGDPVEEDKVGDWLANAFYPVVEMMGLTLVVMGAALVFGAMNNTFDMKVVVEILKVAMIMAIGIWIALRL